MRRKNILLFLLSVCMTLSCMTVVWADAEPAHPYAASALTTGYLFDGADLLYDSEEAELAAYLESLRDRIQLDVVVVTVNSTGMYSPMEYADDYFDYNGYGYGENRDGILLLIAMDTRDWWISTSGYGITAFTDAGIEYIGEQILSDLSGGWYADAFRTFADLCESFVTQARTGDPFDVHNLPKEPFDWFSTLLISLVIGLIVALIYTGVLKGQLHSVQRKPAASEYVREGSLKLHQSQDLFLYRNVRRTVRETSSGSGGSSIHRSSSGRSHGGGGGKF